MKLAAFSTDSSRPRTPATATTLPGSRAVVPASTSPVEKQILIMRDFKTTALVCSPGCAVAIAAALDEQRLHAEALSLRVALLGSEPWSEALRAQLENRLRIVCLDNYGLTEVMGPGVAGECRERQGLHINEDHFIVEVVDPRTSEVLPAGQEGELVFTTITKEGFPLVRYRTGDISSLVDGPCPCGRTSRRMRRVSGRTDDLIFIQGQKIFPSQIEDILLEAEGTAPHFRVVLTRNDGEDAMEVQVEISESVPAIDELKNLERLRDTVARRIQASLGVQAKVTLVEPKSLRREGKPRRVDDRRNV